MSAILYGNLRAEILGSEDVRLQRVTVRQATHGLLRPSQPVAGKPLMLGREREAAAAFTAIRAGRPAGFHAGCGYGKTTLLRNIAAIVSERDLAPSCVYLRADGDRVTDLLQNLVARFYAFDQPVKPTPQECAQLLGQVSAVIVIDDLSTNPELVGYLLDVLSGCNLVIGSTQPVLGRRGSSWKLDGLSDESALALVIGDVGRPLTAGELAAARRLVAAVEGQPLRLRQCAALAREGRHLLGELARQAAHDPEILDRLSISALAQHERRALAVLALAAGTLLPANVVEAVGQIAYVAQWLESLHRRGLAEQRHDRFGLPACKAQSYRQMLFKDLDLAASARALSNWLTSTAPTAVESQSAAEAALSIMEFAAERGDWASAIRLARAAGRVLFLAGRWQAWHHTLSQGMQASIAAGDRAAEAFFAHQQGTLAFCQDQLDDARRLLRQSLALRERLGDDAEADVTRHNLRLLALPDPPRPPRHRVPYRAVRIVGGVLATLALATATVAITSAITSAMRSGRTTDGRPTGSPGPSVTRSASPSMTYATSPVSSSSHSGSSQAQSSESSPHPLQLTPTSMSAAAVGTADSQRITASGGTPPYAFSLAAGSLPPGMSLSGAGVISGTPTAAGGYQFTVAATDASSPADRGSQPYTLRVMPSAVTITPAALPAATAGIQYSQQFIGAGGTAPYTFSWSGTLPPGLSLSTAGLLSGIPAAAGSYQFAVTAADALVPSNRGSVIYTVQVTPVITLSPLSLPPEPATCPSYNVQISASGGTAPYTFSWSGTPPPGLSLSSTGLISGSPDLKDSGSYQFTVTATDHSPSPSQGSAVYTLDVYC